MQRLFWWGGWKRVPDGDSSDCSWAEGASVRRLIVQSMRDETDSDREQGVEFGDLEDDLERQDYPVSTAEILENYGDRTLEFSDGTETLEGVLGPLNDTFQDAGEVKQAIFTMVDSEAVGREGYTDRGASRPVETEEGEETESF